LEDGKIGVIGHQSYNEPKADGTKTSVYVNIAFVFDPVTHAASELRIVGTRPCYPDGPAKRPGLEDCAFTSSIVLRPDGKVDLYSGIGDTGISEIHGTVMSKTSRMATPDGAQISAGGTAHAYSTTSHTFNGSACHLTVTSGNGRSAQLDLTCSQTRSVMAIPR